MKLQIHWNNHVEQLDEKFIHIKTLKWRKKFYAAKFGNFNRFLLLKGADIYSTWIQYFSIVMSYKNDPSKI